MRILVGMSGGADSSFAASRLKNEGHEVEGAVLVMHDYTDVDSAKRAADELGIKLHIINCREEFDKEVRDYFISEYKKGRTPNPCAVCNGAVKFKILHDFAKENGFDKIATGHYAKISHIDGVAVISRSCDPAKDQTYMLYRVPQDILKDLLLPLSDITKTEVRSSLSEIGVSSSGSPDSQEICFIPDNDYVSYIKMREGEALKGSFIDKDGNILGEHNGIVGYTVGQRKGLGIALGRRMFVTEIDPESNTVTLEDTPRATVTLTVSDLKFCSGSEPQLGERITCSVKLRYNARQVGCSLEYLGDARAKVTLDEPFCSIAPGQCAVFYDGDRLLFGGFID